MIPGIAIFDDRTLEIITCSQQQIKKKEHTHPLQSTMYSTKNLWNFDLGTAKLHNCGQSSL